VAAQASLLFLGYLLAIGQETFRPLLGDLLRNKISLNILNKANGLDVSFFENEQFYNKLQNAYQEAGYRPVDLVFQLFFIIQTLITISTLIIRLYSK